MSAVAYIARCTSSVAGGSESTLTVDTDAHVVRTSAGQAVGVGTFKYARVVGQSAARLAALTEVGLHT
jgi:hypothetical protein